MGDRSGDRGALSGGCISRFDHREALVHCDALVMVNISNHGLSAAFGTAELR